MTILVALPDEAMREAVGPVDSAEIIVWTAGASTPERQIDLLVLPYVVTWQALGLLNAGDVRYIQG